MMRIQQEPVIGVASRTVPIALSKNKEADFIKLRVSSEAQKNDDFWK